MIDAYSFGRITVNKKEFTEDVIVSEEKTVERKAEESHFVSLKEIKKAVKEFQPETIVVGLGASGCVQVDEKVWKFLGSKGIGIITENSNKAMDCFNELIEKGRKAVAIMHLTC